MTKETLSKYLLPLFGALCLFPIIDPALALVMGIAFTLLIGNVYKTHTEKLSRVLLIWGVIGLGANMNLLEVLQAGASGFVYTAISIILVMGLGLLLARTLKVSRQNGLLITVGTAICGGSAIAAIAPVIHARSSSIAISLAVVFIMNAVALIALPYIGHALEMSQHSFGLWAALAIHDTSSVVGAGLKFGEEALQTGTSVKLARALWIVPMVLAVQALYVHDDLPEGEPKPKRKYPWFILGFLALAALVTFFPVLSEAGEWVAYAARRDLVLTLFLIGANIHADVLKSVGFRPFVFGVLLWLLVAIISLAAILAGAIV